jgi:hypothetical protein
MAYANTYSPLGAPRIVSGRRQAIGAPGMYQQDEQQAPSILPSASKQPAIAPGMYQANPSPTPAPGMYNSVNRQTPNLAAVRANANHALARADFASMAPMAPAGPSYHMDGTIFPGSQERNQQANAAGRYSYVQSQERAGNQLLAPLVGSNSYSQDQRAASMLPGMYQAATDKVNAEAEGTRAGVDRLSTVEKSHAALQSKYDALELKFNELYAKSKAGPTAADKNAETNATREQNLEKDREAGRAQAGQRLTAEQTAKDQERVDTAINGMIDPTKQDPIEARKAAEQAVAGSPGFINSSATKPYNYQSPPAEWAQRQPAQPAGQGPAGPRPTEQAAPQQQAQLSPQHLQKAAEHGFKQGPDGNFIGPDGKPRKPVVRNGELFLDPI